jgi:DNA-binding NarL/FixJ family response regulator
VFDLIGEGLTTRQIGERMFLADKTVKNYVSSVLTSSGCSAVPRPRRSLLDSGESATATSGRVASAAHRDFGPW